MLGFSPAEPLIQKGRNGRAMFRITVQDNPELLTLKLEGKLADGWVQELENCWRKVQADRHPPAVRVDLTGVTFIDAAGKAVLAAMHAAGAEFVACDCLMKATVAEITSCPMRKQV